MRVTQQQLQQLPLKQNQNVKELGKAKSSQGKSYTIGQRFTAIVLSIMDNLTTLDINGDKLSAENISDSPLYPGQQIKVEVAGEENGNILLKLIEGEGKAANTLFRQLADQLRDIGIPFNDKNITTIKQMHEQGINVNKDNFTALQKTTAALEELCKDLINNPEQKINWHASAKETLLAKTNLISNDQTAVVNDNQTPTGDKSSAVTRAENQSPTTAEAKGEVAIKSDVELKSTANSAGEKADIGLAKSENESKAKNQGGINAKLSAEQAEKVEQQDKIGNKAINSKATVESKLASTPKAEPINNKEQDYQVLDKQLKSMLLDLVQKQPTKLSQTLAFMQKNNIPNNMLNLLLSSELLSGKLDIMSSLLESLNQDRENIPEELSKISDKLTNLTLKLSELPTKMDGESLKEMVETANLLSKELATIKANSENGSKAEHIAIAKESQAILDNAPIAWQNIHLPLQIQKEIEDIDIYIKGDAQKKSKFNPDDGLIYIALNTKNMDRVKVKLKFKVDTINIDFNCVNKTISKFMLKHKQQMIDRIKVLSDKEIVVNFNSDTSKVNLADMEKVDIAKITAFDIKV